MSEVLIPMSTATTPTQPPLTSVQLATAFDGKLERAPLSVGYHIGVLLVACAMVLLPLAYFAMIAGTLWLVGWHATHPQSKETIELRSKH